MTDSSRQPPLHLAAFDHRESFRRMIDEVAPGESGLARRVELKLLIWRGIARRLAASAHAGVLVDPDAGAVVGAARGHATTAIALERSGQRWLAPDRDLPSLAALMATWQPTFGKVLMRWHPGDPRERRRDQVAVLAGLFAIAREVGAHTLLELLVPAEGPDAQLATTDPDVYRSEVLPVRLADSVRQLADAGIVPDLWKIDGLDRSGAACVVGHAVAEVSDGRAGIVVLGAGRDVGALVTWFAATANQPNFCGFAVGRSIWWPPLHRHLRGELDTEQTELAIGDAFADVVRVYEEAVG